MDKAIVADKVAQGVWLGVAFHGDGRLTIESDIVEIANLHGTDITVEMLIVVLHGTEYGVKPLLGLPFPGFARSCPQGVVGVVLYHNARSLVI